MVGLWFLVLVIVWACYRSRRPCLLCGKKKYYCAACGARVIMRMTQKEN